MIFYEIYQKNQDISDDEKNFFGTERQRQKQRQKQRQSVSKTQYMLYFSKAGVISLVLGSRYIC